MAPLPLPLPLPLVWRGVEGALADPGAPSAGAHMGANTTGVISGRGESAVPAPPSLPVRVTAMATATGPAATAVAAAAVVTANGNMAGIDWRRATGIGLRCATATATLRRRRHEAWLARAWSRMGVKWCLLCSVVYVVHVVHAYMTHAWTHG